VQFLWRPGSAGEGLVVTQGGDLFLARLGARPDGLTAACIGKQGVGAAAWSADGSLLALATGATLTVMHLDSGLAFSTLLASQVIRRPFPPLHVPLPITISLHKQSMDRPSHGHHLQVKYASNHSRGNGALPHHNYYPVRHPGVPPPNRGPWVTIEISTQVWELANVNLGHPVRTCLAGDSDSRLYRKWRTPALAWKRTLWHSWGRGRCWWVPGWCRGVVRGRSPQSW